MIPPLIVREAVSKGIQLIAVTDHNATANIQAVQTAAIGTGLFVLPGMELQTSEEVHVLCLFDTLAQTEEWQKMVDLALPNMENRPDFFGEQFVVDDQGEFIRRETRLLSVSVNMSLEEAWQRVNSLGGLFIPAHVNRTAFSLIANLGFVPTGIPIEALEITRHLSPAEAVKRFPMISGYPLIQNGDVHRLDEFLGSTQLTLELPSIAEIRKAIHTQIGRSLCILSQHVDDLQ